MQPIPVPGTLSELPDEAQTAIGAWLAALAEQRATGDAFGRKLGLWVAGPRRSGTSHVAVTAMREAVRTRTEREMYGTHDWEYTSCLDLVELIKQSWDETAPADAPAQYDAMVVERKLDSLWGSDLLCVDDMHPATSSMVMLARSVFPKLEYRIKCGKPVVVSTSLDADSLGSVAPVVYGDHGLFTVYQTDAVR